MERALKAVVNGNHSIRQAAEEFNVPKSTLGDRVSGRTQMGSVSGPPRILTDKEEAELVKFLIGCSASQPLDRSCFGPLKTSWSRVSHKFMSDNPVKVVSIFQRGMDDLHD